MNATEATLLPFMESRAHFIIPVYQRIYTWTPAQCNQLWKDVMSVFERGTGYRHFLGAVVYIEHKDTVLGGTPELLVIDGQQRLTTVSLLLAALCEVLPTEKAEEVRHSYLINGLTKDPQGRRKLILTQRDKDTLFSIATGEPMPDDPAASLVANLAFFREKLAEPGVNPLQVLSALASLQFVNVKLKGGEDDPQRIFESLNATGIKLSQSDLVRNTLLMSLPPDEQRQVYDHYWHKLERLMLVENDPERFDRMLRDFLGSGRGALVNQRALHDEVRAHLDAGTSRAGFARDLYDFGKAWYDVAVSSADLPAQTDVALRGVRQQGNAGVAIPFLARLLFQLRRENGDLAQLTAAARWAESYTMRRHLCQLPTNVLNKTFIVLARDCPIENVAGWLQERTSRFNWNQRFPGDNELLSAMQTRDIYSMRGVREFLTRIEDHERKEPTPTTHLTIEHILPQNSELSHEWREMLGEDWQGIQSRRLHTLGNLTLTGYNSELSDRPFAVKKTMPGGFAESPIRLSQDLKLAEVWNEDAIAARGQRLAQVILDIWPRPITAQMDESMPQEDAKAERKLEFWTELLTETARLSPKWEGMSIYANPFRGVGTGISGIGYYFWLMDATSRVEFRLDTDSPEANLRAFYWLSDRRGEIEAAFGEPLKWREMPDNRVSVIEFRIDVGSESDPEAIEEAIPNLARRMAALERAFAPLIPGLREVIQAGTVAPKSE